MNLRERVLEALESLYIESKAIIRAAEMLTALASELDGAKDASKPKRRGKAKPKAKAKRKASPKVLAALAKARAVRAKNVAKQK